MTKKDKTIFEEQKDGSWTYTINGLKSEKHPTLAECEATERANEKTLGTVSYHHITSKGLQEIQRHIAPF
jgi:hypothetical protein